MSTKRIRELNDRCRQAWGVYPNTRVMITSGIQALSAAVVSGICEKVQTFDQFTEGDDPYGEHDFGAFDHAGHRVFWKIDYYDLECANGSENPSDPTVTCRVLTILLAEEY